MDYFRSLQFSEDPPSNLTNHRYIHPTTGDSRLVGFPTSLDLPSLYCNWGNIHYRDTEGTRRFYYERQRDRPDQTYGLEKTLKWFRLHKGKQITLIIYHRGGYTTSVLRPIAFNGTHIILQ